MKYTTLRSKAEFQSDYHNKIKKFDERKVFIQTLEEQNPKASFFVKGYSITADAEVKFIVDREYANEGHINWRESLLCPETKLNNRTRFAYHTLTKKMGTHHEENIYITEQLTPLFKFLQKNFNNLIGSEFINPEMGSGEINSEGVRHEDLTQLSFQDDSLDKIMSFDCLEHIPDYKSAIKEILRVLKPGGKVLMSFPFDANRNKHLVRAIVNADGKIEHITEPEYHGDPINDKGCLSFYDFGWDILKEMNSVGFQNPHVLTGWSDEFGYLGDEQILVVANKPRLSILRPLELILWFGRKIKAVI